MVKVLFVTRAKINTLKNEAMFRSLEKMCELDVLRLEPVEFNDHMSKTLKSVDSERYDCTVLHLPFRKIKRKARIINNMKNIVIYDYDTYRNFLKKDECYKKYEKFFRKLKNAKIVCSSYSVSKRYVDMGFDAEFLYKGYDNTFLKNINKKRDIELGFIGNLSIGLYKERKQLLETLADEFGLKIFTTRSRDEYLSSLNRIKIFISADINYSEYMAKNYEALGCGCLLMAFEQGDGEEEALGLKDMENAVFYKNIDDAREKIRILLDNPDMVEKIADSGYQHALANFGATSKAEKIHSILKEYCAIE